MEQLKVEHTYVALEQAGALLGVSVDELIHAGAFNQVQICVNIYARAAGLRMRRIDLAINGDYIAIDEKDGEEAKSHDTVFCEWIERLKNNTMPPGIYEVTQDDLRLLEMRETTTIEMGEAFKSDERGLWEVELKPLVEITRSDLVMLATEIDRIQKSSRLKVAPIDKPLSTRERTSYLNIIGALLSQLTAGKANDTTVIKQAVIDFGTKQGISERKLQQTFAEAKRSLDAS